MKEGWRGRKEFVHAPTHIQTHTYKKERDRKEKQSLVCLCWNSIAVAEATTSPGSRRDLDQGNKAELWSRNWMPSSDLMRSRSSCIRRTHKKQVYFNIK